MNRLMSVLMCLILLSAFAPISSAQPAEFALAPGRVGEAYEQNLLETLHDPKNEKKYTVERSERSILTWTLVGRLPEGLELNPTDGSITGVPAPQRSATYRFRIRVTDSANARALPLSLSFTIRIQPARLRLVPDNSLRLVPSSEAGERARNAHPSRRRAAAPTAVPATFARSPRNTTTASANSVEGNAGPSAAANVQCQEIEIETARKSPKQEIPVTFIVKSGSIRSLDIVVRGEQKSSSPKRVNVPAGTGDGSPAEISESIILMAGENIIAVSGLDERRRSVGCGEKVVVFTPAPGQADNAERANAGGNGNGGHATAQPQPAGPQAERASRFTATLPAQGENAALGAGGLDPEAQSSPTPTPDPKNIGRLLKYISVFEGKRGKKREDLYKGDLANNPLSFADRNSIITVELVSVGEGTNSEQPPEGTEFLVSAVLEGNNVLNVEGPQSGTTASGSQTSAKITKDTRATINLKGTNAKKGDQLAVEIRGTDGASGVLKTFTIELDDYDFERSPSPSLFLLSRPGVSASDLTRALQTGMPTTTNPAPIPMPVTDVPSTDINNPVSYSPSPGFNYMFSYKPKPNKGGGWKFLSLMEPGFGINATFTDFNDQTLSFENALQRIRDRDSDVQIGVGGVASFFGNTVHLTYGANLNVEKQRGYFGFGIDVLKLINIVRPD